MSLELRPITLREARRFVGENHRHNLPPKGWLFGVGVEDADVLVGVGVASRPVGRGLQDGRTMEVTRTCTTGARNANSKLYGALAKAAFALGYWRVVSYTLAEEPGASLLATGFELDAELPARDGWDYTGQVRLQHDLFGSDRRPPGEKRRWVRYASPAARYHYTVLAHRVGSHEGEPREGCPMCAGSNHPAPTAVA